MSNECQHSFGDRDEADGLTCLGCGKWRRTAPTVLLPEAKTRAEIDQLIEAIRDLVLSVPQDQRYYLFGYLDICINCGRDTRGKIRSCQCSNDD